MNYSKLTPRTCVVGIDATYFGKDLGLIIFKDLTNNVVLHWMFVRHENIFASAKGIEYIKKQGIIPIGYVVDGTWGFFVRYGSSENIQMCLMHMKNLVKRYITSKPKLKAGKELKEIIDKLSYIKERDFNREYGFWLKQYKDFLKERTCDRDGNSIYTHQRLRSAVNSINKYKPYLFTYQKNTRLPATNNSVEGTNSGLKGFLKVHQGLRPDRKVKLIHYYLKEKSKFEWGLQK